MLSARPFWVLFTLCVIVLIEWLIVPRIVDGVFSKDIASMTISLRDIESVLLDHDLKMPPEILPRLAKNPDELVTGEDLRYFSFRSKWVVMSALDSAKAIGYAAGLFATGILAGFLFASVAFRHLVKFGDRLVEMSGTDKIAMFLGLLIGVVLSAILLPLITSLLGRNPVIIPVTGLVIVYFCVVGMMSMKEELKYYFPSLARGTDLDKTFQKPKLLDTNIIIDGRIVDICRAGFVEGQIVVPNFVLEELQHIADSSDSLRRARGRRGLDILNQMRKEMNLSIRPNDAVDPANPEEVDMRLVKLAKDVEGAIVTNDFNLNKVAELHGVTVLNINELANALKPVALPGEEMTVSIVKEGKSVNQGIAYLDDGTMVVVEGGKRHIGDTVDVVVTSVVQTVAGRMIFTNLKEVQEQEDDLIDRNVRSYSSFRPGKKAR